MRTLKYRIYNKKFSRFAKADSDFSLTFGVKIIRFGEGGATRN